MIHKTAAKRIEQTRNIKTKEMAWYRSRLGEFRSAALKRESDKVSISPPKKGDTSLIQTHPWSKKPERNNCMPSFSDLRGWFQNLPNGIRYNHIAQLDKQGKAIGYSSFLATKTLLSHLERAKQLLPHAKLNPGELLFFRIIDKVSNRNPESIPEEKMRDLILDFSIKNRFFIHHKKPFQGYHFNKNKRSFEKK